MAYCAMGEVPRTDDARNAVRRRKLVGSTKIASSAPSARKVETEKYSSRIAIRVDEGDTASSDALSLSLSLLSLCRINRDYVVEFAASNLARVDIGSQGSGKGSRIAPKIHNARASRISARVHAHIHSKHVPQSTGNLTSTGIVSRRACMFQAIVLAARSLERRAWTVRRRSIASRAQRFRSSAIVDRVFSRDVHPRCPSVVPIHGAHTWCSSVMFIDPDTG